MRPGFINSFQPSRILVPSASFDPDYDKVVFDMTMEGATDTTFEDQSFYARPITTTGAPLFWGPSCGDAGLVLVVDAAASAAAAPTARPVEQDSFSVGR